MPAERVVTTDMPRTNDFTNERALADYVVLNAQKFCEDVLEDSYVAHSVEPKIDGRRPDIVFHGARTTHIVELKVPRHRTVNRQAIGQLLNYGRLFLDAEKSLVLVTTVFDQDTAQTIEEYGLPIRYIFLSKTCSMEFHGSTAWPVVH